MVRTCLKHHGVGLEPCGESCAEAGVGLLSATGPWGRIGCGVPIPQGATEEGMPLRRRPAAIMQTHCCRRSGSSTTMASVRVARTGGDSKASSLLFDGAAGCFDFKVSIAQTFLDKPAIAREKVSDDWCDFGWAPSSSTIDPIKNGLENKRAC